MQTTTQTVLTYNTILAMFFDHELNVNNNIILTINNEQVYSAYYGMNNLTITFDCASGAELTLGTDSTQLLHVTALHA